MNLRDPGPQAGRRAAGRCAHAAGVAAEDGVWSHYSRSGHRLAARRWRAPGGGEIDLIARKNGRVIFVEVKRARDFSVAASRLGNRQIGRIFRSAEAFLGGEPAGTDTEARFDVALVDATGSVMIIENAYAA